MNLGLGTSAGIGERKSEVSGHRDVTSKSVIYDVPICFTLYTADHHSAFCKIPLPTPARILMLN